MSKFRLAGLMRLKKLKEDTAAAEMAKRTGARREAERRRDLATQRIGESALDSAGGTSNFMAQVAARSSLFSDYEMAKVLVADAERAEAEAQKVYAEAKKDAKTLEKLEAKHIEAERAAEERAEQLVLDELATQRAFRGEHH